MSLKTKTLLGALVLTIVAYGYYTYNNANNVQDVLSTTGIIIEGQVDNVQATPSPSTRLTFIAPTVEVKANPDKGVPVEHRTETEKTGASPVVPSGE